jgi:hypothetical protein
MPLTKLLPPLLLPPLLLPPLLLPAVPGRTRAPNETNGKSSNLNNALKNHIFPQHLKCGAEQQQQQYLTQP